MNPTFANRTAAGQLLATELLRHLAGADIFVLGITPGGVPVAAAVARQWSAPMDALVVRALELPCRSDLSVGTLTSGGVCILNDDVIDSLDIETDTISALRRHAEAGLAHDERVYRGGRPPPDLKARTVVVVHDVVQPDATLHAAIVDLHQQGVVRAIVAAPVIARAALPPLRSIADQVIALVISDEDRPPDAWFHDPRLPRADDVSHLSPLQPEHSA